MNERNMYSVKVDDQVFIVVAYNRTEARTKIRELLEYQLSDEEPRNWVVSQCSD